MTQGNDLVRSSFTPYVHRHVRGGWHLDVLALDPRVMALVGDDDTAQYADGRWRCAELLARDACPEPTETSPVDDPGYWLDDLLAAGEQWAAYRYLAPTAQHAGPILQIGGRGASLVRWMKATGRTGILLAPFDVELDHCRELARAAGVVDALLTVCAPAEAVPLRTGVVGTALAPGVLHHTDVGPALTELVRVVAPDGRFATWDVWSSPAYRAGIAIFGKQEDIRCHPLTAERLAAAPPDTDLDISWGGGLLRYPVAVLSRLGVRLSPSATVPAGLIDRWLCRRVPPVRHLAASLVSIHGRGGAVVELPSGASTAAAAAPGVAAQAPGRPSAR